jgi:hypothetical protein
MREVLTESLARQGIAIGPKRGGRNRLLVEHHQNRWTIFVRNAGGHAGSDPDRGMLVRKSLFNKTSHLVSVGAKQVLDVPVIVAEITDCRPRRVVPAELVEKAATGVDTHLYL